MRFFQGPSQRALVLDSFSFRPDKIPNLFSMSKAFWADIRLLKKREVSSANWQILSSLLEINMPQIELSCPYFSS